MLEVGKLYIVDKEPYLNSFIFKHDGSFKSKLIKGKIILILKVFEHTSEKFPNLKLYTMLVENEVCHATINDSNICYFKPLTEIE
jgi:hypothetical protein